jgi:nicotinamide phosphoribosyltransferase
MEATQTATQTVTLPSRKVHKTPRLLLADAYTVGSNDFESPEAREKSVYYITFRRKLNSINPVLYPEGDNRIIFGGLQRILEKLFYEPITHAEIDEAKEFLKTFKATMAGPAEYAFPEQLWRTIVDEFNGRPPIKITAMPEGSVVYPNEPVVIIENPDSVLGMGIMAAWFESKLLQVWAVSERITQNEHWMNKMKKMVLRVNRNLDAATVNFLASLMLTDFGDRAGITLEESEELGMAHLYTFPGTDTCSGAYQAWVNAGRTPVGSSVNALAHRNVQGFDFEGDCYTAIYEFCKDNEIISMVSDCYDFEHAVENMILPLALRSIEENNGKVVVARPDSGDALKQVIWTIELAIKNGLYTSEVINGKEWFFGTSLKFIEGDGMTHQMMDTIIEALMEKGYAPFGWGLFGQGGGLRNDLKRDNLSAKYALCCKGLDLEGVVKFSETLGKTTLAGPFKVLRSAEALANKVTIVHTDEEGEDAMVLYFDGTNINKPFGEGQDDDFLTIKARKDAQFYSMPLDLTRGSNNYPASEKVLVKRIELLEKYAPNKDVSNY